MKVAIAGKIVFAEVTVVVQRVVIVQHPKITAAVNLPKLIITTESANVATIVNASLVHAVKIPVDSI